LGLLAQLKKELLQEKNFSRIDYLTGIANNKTFYEKLAIEKSRCLRNKTPLTIAYLDCDYFKVVNDVFGHKKGDIVLQLIASTIQDNIRMTDLVARISGDEFMILLPETGKETAQKVIHRTQNQLLGIMKQNKWPVTFSIGVATFINFSDSIDEMVVKADNLMYSAKDGGRNLIHCAEFNNF
jgi:diguanylate cyclase (GGDEF)-like protein